MPVQLLSVENTIHKQRNQFVQTLVFYLRLENAGYEKQVDVLWQDHTGIERVLPAHFFESTDTGYERWRAEISVHTAKKSALPGDIHFRLRYRVNHHDYCFPENGEKAFSPANSGVQLGEQITFLHAGQIGYLGDKQQTLPLTIMTAATLHAQKVSVHWTGDNWRQVRQSSCRVKPQNASQRKHASARVWTVELPIEHAFKIQYCIKVETPSGVIWDNRNGHNYSLSRKPIKVLILNLHCYQESRQDYKFWQIAKAINDHAVDIICLQEVAELWNNGHGDWPSNSARIIQERLQHPYHLYTDWSHLGFDRYREGVAILSRLPVYQQESRYVSDSQDVYNIHARKAVFTQVNAPFIGIINVFCAHLSWWEDGFAGQFKRLSEWAAEKQDSGVQATLLCGDFNIAAGSEGYRLVVNKGEYSDQFLAANAQGVYEKIFKVNDPHWRDYLADDYRIDYIFMNKTSRLQVTSASVLFTEHDYGRVSDHCGYLMTFEPV